MCDPGTLSTIGSVMGIGTSIKSLTSSTPSATAVNSPATNVSTTGSDALDATNDARKKAAMAQGFQSTIATSSAGDTSTATTAKKTLLGG